MSPSRPAKRYDLVIRGGEVIDPGSGQFGHLDIAVSDGRIAEVAADIPAVQADSIVDAAGLLVLPGLVDLHTHVFWGGTYWGIDPVQVAGRSGTTTWVDAGSAGAFSLEVFRRACVETAPVQIKAFLNIATIGLVAETGELRRAELCDGPLCAETVRRNRDLVIGIKCRVDANTVGERGTAPLLTALQAAEDAGVAMMVHVGKGPPTIDEVLEVLRPGDILTHCTTGHSMKLIDDSGKLRASASRARSRGVLFDVGHGYGAFSLPVARALVAEGALPDVISSDAHQRSVRGVMGDLPTCMNKFLSLGVPLRDVVRAATIKPAQVAGVADVAGSLGPGRPADIALFEMQGGNFPLQDVEGRTWMTEQLLVNRMTLVKGRFLPPRDLEPPPPWIAEVVAPR